ncbi:MAG: DUF937 domain-containing protein [Pseudomonadota bacterium]
MSGILDLITDKLSSGALEQIGRQIGADSGATEKAMQMALPVILGQLSRNAQSQDKVGGLAAALDKEHDGSILDDLGGFLNRGAGQREERMVGHIFGDRQEAVQRRLGGASGLDAGAIQKLLATLGPLVMGAVGKKRQQAPSNDGFGGLGGLTDLMKQDRVEADSRSKGFSLVDQLLDADGDGDVDASDLLKRGGSLLGGLFGGR